jgi:hypothetical protein
MQRSNVSLVVWDSRNGSYGILAIVGTCLLYFEVGRPDHLAPLLGFVGDEFAELGG